MSARPSSRTRVVDAGFAVVATAVAAAAFWPVYEDARFVALVAVALVLGASIAAAGARWRWPAAVVVPVTAVALVVAGVPVAVPSRAWFGVLPSPEGIAELLAALALSWKRLLTIALPVGDYQSLLVPAWVLVLAAAVISVTIALRARIAELALAPPVVLFLAGIVFGPDSAPWPAELALGLLAVLLLWLAWRRWRRRRDAIRELTRATRGEATGAAAGVLGVRTMLSAGLIVAVAAATGVTAATAFPPQGERDVLRAAVAQPFDPREHPSPLAGLRRYLRDDRAGEVMLRVEGLPDGARIRIATLDSYDGVVYAVGSSAADGASGSFVRIPRAVDRSGAEGRRVRLRVEIVGYSGVWLPTVGDFESIEFEGPGAARLREAFFFNATTGTAADIEGIDEGVSYRLWAVLPSPTAESELATATPGGAHVPRLGVIPDELRLYLEEQARGLSDPGARLLAALEALRRDGYISHGLGPEEPPSRSGHGADRIAELVSASRMIGDAEQYAVAAALMARQIGFPARVVFGFAPEGGGGDAVAVTGADATAWIEVHTAEHGWVAIDPVPPERPIPDDVPEEDRQVARPPSIVPPPADRPDPPVEQSAPESSQDDRDALDPVLQALLAAARVVGALLLVLAIAATPFLLVVLAKWRRRRLRRAAPTPLQRIRGGWDEFADTAVDFGYSPPPAATRSEVAAAVGVLPARVLAAVADRAVFSPGEPDPVEAERVWNAVEELRRALGAGRTRRERLQALVSVRSLGGYHVRRRFGGRGRAR